MLPENIRITFYATKHINKKIYITITIYNSEIWDGEGRWIDGAFGVIR